MPTLLTSGLVIEHLAHRIRNYTNLRKGLNKMARLDEKWAKAGGVIARSEKLIEDKLDALIARETEIAKKTTDVFARQNAPIDEANQALDALDAKLNLLSNGGPSGPLPGSGDSQEVKEPVKPPPVTLEPQAPPTNPAPVSAAQGGLPTQEVGQAAQSTFQALR